jgi:hypothetical protein
MTIAAPVHDIFVEAPDGPAALDLEHRLADRSPVSICHQDRWTVFVPAVRDTAEVEAVVRTWLAEIGTASTRIVADGATRTIERKRRTGHVASNARFIG